MTLVVAFNVYKMIGLIIKHRWFQSTLRTIGEKQPQRDIYRIA